MSDGIISDTMQEIMKQYIYKIQAKYRAHIIIVTFCEILTVLYKLYSNSQK